jgi:hypothetical protein
MSLCINHVVYNMQPASVHVQDDPTDDTIGDIQVQDNDHTVSTVSYFV